MSLFIDPLDEERLCKVLKAYVEEFGPEHVTVQIPIYWRPYASENLGRVQIEYGPSDSISINVRYMTARLSYKVNLLPPAAAA